MFAFINYRITGIKVKCIRVRQINLHTINKIANNDDMTEAKNSSSSLKETNESDAISASAKLNKSRLLDQHRRILHECTPYDEPSSWIHLSEKYKRKMFGRYGFVSRIDARICFQKRDDVKINAEFEKAAHPYSLTEMIARFHLEQERGSEQINKRETDLKGKLERLEQWKNELNTKIIKREAEALVARERKERLIEEVRRHFGFKVDPRDERFKEMLEQKEKEDKKKLKEARRKAKEEKIMAKLIQNTSDI